MLVNIKARNFLLLFLFVGNVYSALAQYEHLLHKPYGENVEGIHEMYQKLIHQPDSLTRVREAEVIINFARQHKDQRLELNVDFFWLYWNTFHQNQDKAISLSKILEQLERVSVENVDFLRARSLRLLAEYYWGLEKNYELAFEQYLLLNQELENTNPEEYPEMARDFMQIGKAYYFFQDYPLAIYYFKKATALPETNFTTLVINDARNTLGLSYQKMNKLDSADYYFNQILKTNFVQSNVWKRIAKGNLGTNHYLRKQFDQAIPLLETDFYGAVKDNDYGCAAGASILLADIAREKGRLGQAREWLAHAQVYVDKAQQPDRLRELYPIMSKYYMAIGDMGKAKLYIDSSVVALQQYNEKFSALKILKAQQRVERQKHELQLASIALEKQQKMAERNLFALLVVVLIVIIILYYQIQKKRQLEHELQLQESTKELEIAGLKLKNYTESILEKNRLIEELQQQGERIEKATIHRELQQRTILTEEDWQAFQHLFEKAHPGYIARVRETYAGLSNGELRYFVLCRLHLKTKEMASILGVSPNAIEVMRHRILKKLQLSSKTSLEEIILNN